MNESETGYVMQPAPQVVLTPAAPAAGQPLNIVADGNYRARLVAVTFQIVTSANVANRLPYVAIMDGDQNTLALEAAAVSVPAGSAQTLFAHAGRRASDGVAGAVSLCPVPGLTLEPGWMIQLGSWVLDGADQIRFASVTLERFPNIDVEPAARQRQTAP